MPTDPRTIAMRLSLLLAVLLLAGKLVGAGLTGSTAILSDAAESIIHIIATGGAAISLWYSRRPADANHPYGHGKIAFFSAGFEGAMIFMAAVGIIALAVADLIHGPQVARLEWGMLITVAVVLIDLALGLYLIRTGRRTNSLILIANGQHIMTDMWTSLGVLIGVIAVWLTDIVWFDPICAIAVGINIIVTAVMLMRRSLGGLLDTAHIDQTQMISDCLDQARQSGEIMGFHQIRHRVIDDVMWIEVHMFLESEMSLDEAHHRVTRIEACMRELFPKLTVHITTHMEPGFPEEHEIDGHEEPPDATGGCVT